MKKHWANGSNTGIPGDEGRERLAEDEYKDARGEGGGRVKSQVEGFKEEMMENRVHCFWKSCLAGNRY